MDGEQAEAWDDSVLIGSWDGAYAEYKKYHSIAAQKKAAKALKAQSNSDTAAASGKKEMQYDSTEVTDAKSGEIDLEKLKVLAATSEYWKGYLAGFTASLKR